MPVIIMPSRAASKLILTQDRLLGFALTTFLSSIEIDLTDFVVIACSLNLMMIFECAAKFMTKLIQFLHIFDAELFGEFL